jgi:hypothetical protein
MGGSNLLVLDLDETIVFASEREMPHDFLLREAVAKGARGPFEGPDHRGRPAQVRKQPWQCDLCASLGWARAGQRTATTGELPGRDQGRAGLS